MSKLLLLIHFHTKPNDMSAMKAIRVTFDTFRAAFFFLVVEAGSFHLADIS